MPRVIFELSKEGAEELLCAICRQAAVDYRDGLHKHWPQKIRTLGKERDMAYEALKEAEKVREERIEFLRAMGLNSSSDLYHRMVDKYEEYEIACKAYKRAVARLRNALKQSQDFYTAAEFLPESFKDRLINGERLFNYKE